MLDLSAWEYDLVKIAQYVAERAHFGQKDKSSEDYILHPLTVASLVTGKREKICALLHDVLEDTDFSEASLRILFGDEIVDTLLVLTHRDGESYRDYIERIAENELATRVKLADLAHNSDLSRLREVTQADLQRYEKYQRAREFLLKRVDEQ